jgi:hypothetical protein
VGGALRAEALTLHGRLLLRLGRGLDSRRTLRLAVEAADVADDALLAPAARAALAAALQAGGRRRAALPLLLSAFRGWEAQGEARRAAEALARLVGLLHSLLPEECQDLDLALNAAQGEGAAFEPPLAEGESDADAAPPPSPRALAAAAEAAAEGLRVRGGAEAAAALEEKAFSLLSATHAPSAPVLAAAADAVSKQAG